MKEIIFYYSSMTPSGGVERVMTNLVNKLSDVFSITLLTKDNVNTKPFYDVSESVKLEYLSVPMNLNMKNRFSRLISASINLPQSIIRLRKYLKKNSNSKIYTASPMGTFEAWVALGFNGERIIATEHASFNAYNSVYELMKKIVYPKVSILVVPTTMDTEFYEKKGYPGIYLPHLTTFNEIAGVDIRKKEKVILNVGRLTEDKQQMTLLKIWKELVFSKEIGEWKLEIIGEGELFEDLRDYISKNNLSDSVVLSGPTKMIEDKYRRSSIFAFTSRTEGFGMVLLESMAFGTPCISFDIPSGPRDIIESEVNGYLISNSDITEYKRKLLQLMKNEANLYNLAEGAQMTVMKWPNQWILDTWIKIFNGEKL